MLNVDEFESVFRAADKKTFQLDPRPLERILLVSDLEGDDLPTYVKACEELLEPLGEDVQWKVCGREDWSGIEGVLRLVDEEQPHLIVSTRNLNSDAWKYSYSLGIYLNALLRSTTIPVVVTPNPLAFPDMQWKGNRTDSVMVVEDQLTGDDSLVNWGVQLTRSGGTLHLCHMEHDEIFERYITAISKIPEIDTDTARETLKQHLLKEPRDYIASVKQILEDAYVPLTVKDHVQLGHRAADYAMLVEEHEVDVLVFPALEEDRLALHGASYQLAVELVNTPLLMV